jgi:hypothetical protein
MKADDACGIRSIGAIENRFAIGNDVALNGGSWKVDDNTYTLELKTCEVQGTTAGMPCRDLHFEANLRTKSGRNVYGCWDGKKKCQATWTSKPGHCTITKE